MRRAASSKPTPINPTLPTWENPRFFGPSGEPVEATEDWLLAYSETAEQRELRELKEAVGALALGTRAPIEGDRTQAQELSDADLDALLATAGYERAAA